MRLSDGSFCRLGRLGACALIALTSAALGQGGSRKAGPMTAFDPVPLTCQLNGSTFVVYNSTPADLAKGQKLGWKDSAGVQGTMVLQQRFQRGDRMRGAHWGRAARPGQRRCRSNSPPIDRPARRALPDPGGHIAPSAGGLTWTTAVTLGLDPTTLPLPSS